MVWFQDASSPIFSLKAKVKVKFSLPKPEQHVGGEVQLATLMLNFGTKRR